MVTGSPAVDLEHVFPKLVEGLDNLCWLRDERVTVNVNGQDIDIIGLTCTHKPFVDGPRLEQILAKRPDVEPETEPFHHPALPHPRPGPQRGQHRRDRSAVLRAHPRRADPPAGFGALFAASLYGKRFESGRRTVGNLTLYVTRGIGLEGKAAPRVRFLCPPEIILWEIDGENNINVSRRRRM